MPYKVRPIITCIDCGRERPHCAQNRCQSCWRTWRHPDLRARKRRMPLAEFCERYNYLIKNQPMIKNEEIAKELGMTYSGVSRAAARGRRAGLITLMRKSCGRHGASIDYTWRRQ